MTTEEKLERFHTLCMEEARAQYQRVIEDYQKGLDAAFEEHKADAKRRSAMRIQIETEKIEREAKRCLAADQTAIRRKLSERQEELKRKLFEEAEACLSSLRGEDFYLEALKKQAAEIRAAADGAAYEIFVDEKDAALCGALGQDVKVGDVSFGGGMIGMIPEKNLVIDHSFRTQLAEEKERFSLQTA